MQSNSFSYSLKVWLTSVILAPFIYLMIEAFQKKSPYLSSTDIISEQISTYPIFILAGGLFSFVTWILFFLTIKVITIYFYQVNTIKIIIALFGVLLTFGTFAVFMPMSINSHNEFFYLILAYAACIAGGGCLYKLEIMQELDTFSK